MLNRSRATEHHGTTEPGGDNGDGTQPDGQAAPGNHELGRGVCFLRRVEADADHHEHVERDAGEDDVFRRHGLFFLSFRAARLASFARFKSHWRHFPCGIMRALWDFP